MKPKTVLLVLMGLAALTLRVPAQNPPPGSDGVPPAAAPGSAPGSAGVSPATAPGDAAPSPAAAPAGILLAAEATPAGNAAVPSPTPQAEATSTNVPIAPDANAPRPKIVLEQLTLREAISYLGEASGLRIMFDPKLPYGSVDEKTGQTNAEPIIVGKWENVSAKQVLDSLLDNYGLTLEYNPKTTFSRVTKRNEAAPPLETRVVSLDYASPSNMVIQIQPVLVDKRSKVLPDNRSSQVVIIATEKEWQDITNIIARLDKPARQVLIEARLLETALNPTTAKGINWAGTLAAQNISYGNGVHAGTSQRTITSPGTPTTTTLPSGRQVTTTPDSSTAVETVINSVLGSSGAGFASGGLTPAIGFLNADGVHAVLSFFNQDSDTKIISAPRTVTMDNELATVEVGTMHPIVNVQVGNAQVTGGSQINYSNLTVRLDVTPHISGSNNIALRVNPKILRLGDPVHSIVNGTDNVVDSFNKREMVTSVLIPSASTLVMGGLVEDSVKKQGTKVPVMGDLPVLGGLFRSSAKQRLNTDLIIFVTPTIIQSEDFQANTTSEFLKRPVPTTDQVDKAWGPWDTSTPVDWSKPVYTPDRLSSQEHSKQNW